MALVKLTTRVVASLALAIHVKLSRAGRACACGYDAAIHRLSNMRLSLVIHLKRSTLRALPVKCELPSIVPKHDVGGMLDDTSIDDPSLLEGAMYEPYVLYVP